MGYNTDFTGAIRITPKITDPLAGKLEQWLVLRHMRRDVAALEQLYATETERKAHTLFGDGDFGRQGELYLPDQTKEFSTAYFKEEPYPEGLTDNMSMNNPPANCPGLYCDLALVHSKNDACSYVGWDGAENTYDVPEWLRLLASYLVPRGYHLDGTIFANGESGSDFWFIIVDDQDVQVEEFVPESTYACEFNELYKGY